MYKKNSYMKEKKYNYGNIYFLEKHSFHFLIELFWYSIKLRQSMTLIKFLWKMLDLSFHILLSLVFFAYIILYVYKMYIKKYYSLIF